MVLRDPLPTERNRFMNEFNKLKSSTIHPDKGSIVEQNKNITEINTAKGVHIQ